MSFFGNGCNGGFNGIGGQDESLARHISRFIGKTVTIFTTSGGPSGCGFTGCVISVNSNFVRLVTEFGTAPSSPLAENICGDLDGCNGPRNGGPAEAFPNLGDRRDRRDRHRAVGSVCDIPIDRIAAFCHNAI